MLLLHHYLLLPLLKLRFVEKHIRFFSGSTMYRAMFGQLLKALQ